MEVGCLGVRSRKLARRAFESFYSMVLEIKGTGSSTTFL